MLAYAMRPSLITGDHPSVSVLSRRDMSVWGTSGTHLPPLCRRGYRRKRHVSVTRRDECVPICPQASGDPRVAQRCLVRGEVAHLDDQAVAEAEQEGHLRLPRRVERRPHDDRVSRLADHLEPAVEADRDVALDA